MKNILCSISLLLLVGYITSCNKKTNPYQIKNDLSFDCSLKIDSAPELFNILKSINPDLIYFGVCTNKENKLMISVSKYINEEPISIETAFFDYTANKIPENSMGDYKILSSEKYVKDNHTFYRKVSCNNGTIVNVMYYLMKDNKSKNFYEFKMTGYIDEKNYLIDVLEKTVMSVELE